MVVGICRYAHFSDSLEGSCNSEYPVLHEDYTTPASQGTLTQYGPWYHCCKEDADLKYKYQIPYPCFPKE